MHRTTTLSSPPACTTCRLSSRCNTLCCTPATRSSTYSRCNTCNKCSRCSTFSRCNTYSSCTNSSALASAPSVSTTRTERPTTRLTASSAIFGPVRFEFKGVKLR